MLPKRLYNRFFEVKAMELRKDYLLDRWVIISEKRSERPRQFDSAKHEKQEGVCYFCPGNENLTPPEIARINDKKGTTGS